MSGEMTYDLLLAMDQGICNPLIIALNNGMG